MKSLLSILLIALLFFSCSKNNNNMVGEWKMTEAYDQSTGVSTYPPSTITRDAILKFYFGNTFSGQTPENSFSGGNYTMTGNELRFGVCSMTSTPVGDWGQHLINMLMSCLLQSRSPCAPCIITVNGNNMMIKVPLGYILKFERV